MKKRARTLFLLSALMVVGSLILGLTPAALAAYQFTAIDFSSAVLPGTPPFFWIHSYGFGINNLGVVTGNITYGQGGVCCLRAGFVDDGGQITAFLEPAVSPALSFTRATGINDDGLVVGDAFSVPFNTFGQFGFSTYDEVNFSMIDIFVNPVCPGHPLHCVTYGLAVNNLGTIVGERNLRDIITCV